MARDPVLQWAADAAAAEQATGIPASVLLGLVGVESGGREGLTSSAGAGGLTQFMPPTAASHGVDVRPGHARSQLVGAGRYLVELGYHDDPELALRKYNAGPAAPASVLNSGPVRQYAANVLAGAKRYAGFDGGGKGTPTASPTNTPADAGGLVDAGQHSALVKFGVSAALVLAAVVAIATGVSRAAGVRSPLAAAVGA